MGGVRGGVRGDGRGERRREGAISCTHKWLTPTQCHT